MSVLAMELLRRHPKAQAHDRTGCEVRSRRKWRTGTFPTSEENEGESILKSRHRKWAVNCNERRRDSRSGERFAVNPGELEIVPFTDGELWPTSAWRKQKSSLCFLVTGTSSTFLSVRDPGSTELVFQYE